jgi:non-heme chloroperoxidase
MSRRNVILLLLLLAYLTPLLAHPAVSSEVGGTVQIVSSEREDTIVTETPLGLELCHPVDMETGAASSQEPDDIEGWKTPGDPEIKKDQGSQNSTKFNQDPEIHEDPRFIVVPNICDDLKFREATHSQEDARLEARSQTTDKPPIVLIHGLWLTPLCWRHWVRRFEARGYTVHAPGWPGIGNRSPAEIREDPSALDDRSILEIVDYYCRFIQQLDQQPILIGHSFGGLFAQILLSQGFGAAGVAISPAPPAGVFALNFKTLQATLPVLLKPKKLRGTVNITADQFHHNFGNHLSNAQSNILWQEYAVPAIARVLWDGAGGMLGISYERTRVDFDKVDRAPLLLIAGTNDNVVPRSAVERTFKAYKNTKDLEFITFEKRTHGILFQAGWEEVADTAIAFVSSKVV